MALVGFYSLRAQCIPFFYFCPAWWCSSMPLKQTANLKDANDEIFSKTFFFSLPAHKKGGRQRTETNKQYLPRMKNAGIKAFLSYTFEGNKTILQWNRQPFPCKSCNVFFFSPRNANEMSSRWNCAQFAIFSCHHRVATSPVSAPWIISFLGYYPSLVFFISAITFLSVWASCV